MLFINIMEILREIKQIPNLSIASGFFDGVHIAHQKVIKGAVDYAKNTNTKSAVITFQNQPLCSLKHIEPSYISTRADSYDLIEKLGVDYLIELDFDKVYDLAPLDYLKYIVKNFSPCAIFTGFNHHFGYKRQGNPEFLKQYQNSFNYKYFDIPAQKLNGKIVSSTTIRNFIKNGDIESANSMLGREFFVKGTVVSGNQIGRTINFQTANISYPKNLVFPLNGAYQVIAQLQDGREFKAIANFGTKPTVSDKNIKTLETHILQGFNQDIYAEELEIKFLKFLRPEQKFNSLDELKNQIKKDIASIN